MKDDRKNLVSHKKIRIDCQSLEWYNSRRAAKQSKDQEELVMEIVLNYGKGAQTAGIPDTSPVELVLPRRLAKAPTPEEETAMLRRALLEPVESLPLSQLAKGKKPVAIVISDVTRPCPSYRILPLVLEELERAGVADENIIIVTALGSHRRHTPDERRALTGEQVFRRYQVTDSGEEGYLLLGSTPAQTPVEVDARVARAELRVCIGNIEYHYFAGYSGGIKAILPGVCSRRTIQANHRHMTEPGAQAGQLAGNPVREDIESAAPLCPADFILNVALDEKKRVIFAAAGNAVAAHRRGCRFLDSVYGSPIQRQGDIVVVSPGGHPKDINLYQAQKALDNAKSAVRPGGVLILAAECPEGLGEAVFERWMLELPDPSDRIQRIREDFQLGGHKAAAIALAQQRAEIFLVSSLEPGLVERMRMRPFSNLQAALDAAQRKMGKDAAVTLLPYGGATLPLLAKQE